MLEKDSGERFRYLLLRYLENKSTSEETAALFQYLKERKEQDWEGIMTNMMLTEQPMQDYEPEQWHSFIERIKQHNAALEQVHEPLLAKTGRRMVFFRWAAAALLLIIAGYFVFRQPAQPLASGNRSTVTNTVQDIPPGTNKAMLTRADGTVIVLDGAPNGLLASEGNTRVIKQADGQIVYKTGEGSNTAIAWNTMRTPRGGQYSLTLPDGTNVWLNAASSITYPVSFAGNERGVSMTGEAYFEVVKDRHKPFHVRVNEMDIEVLGTSFNVNAYSEEPAISTTLLEGAVKITAGDSHSQLKPGQQALWHKYGELMVKKGVNTAEAVAWKNGMFYFDSTDIQTIMRQVERWYNIKVVYPGPVPKGHYKGRPSRNLTLGQMLKVFKYSGLKFRIENDTMMINE